MPHIPAADYLRLLPSAMAIVAILLCEGLLVVRSYSNKYGYKADGDQMLFAYGAANLAAGFTGSLVTGNSPSRSAAMDGAGAKSQLPSLVAAVTIAVVMLFFTDYLAFLPNAALAGIVANAVLSLIEVHELRELWRMRRSEFWIAAVCLVSVLALGPLRAVLIAFLMSVIDVIRRASSPETSALAGSARRQPLLARGRGRDHQSLRAWFSTGSGPRSTLPTRPSSWTRLSSSSTGRPAPSAGSCWTPKRWSTSTPPARRSCGRRSRC